MAKMLPYIRQQYLDNDGKPLAGGKIHSYIGGSSTPLATYTDQSEDTENTNPVILDGSGCASIWVSDAYYKFVIEDSNGVLIRTIEDVSTEAGQGGKLISVADIAERNAIQTISRYEGMMVYVRSEQANYQLVGGITNDDWVQGSESAGSSLTQDSIINQMNDAEFVGPGVKSSGKIFVDLMNSTDLLDLSASTNLKFVAGGVKASSTMNAPTTVAAITLNADNDGWHNNTIVIRIAAAQIGTVAPRWNVRFAAGTTEALWIRGAFIGHAQTNGSNDFDRAVPPTPLYYSGSNERLIPLNTTSIMSGDFQNTAGRDIIIAYYVGNDAAKGMARRLTSATGWATAYKSAANEPAKYNRSGYTQITGSLGVDQLTASTYTANNLTAVSKQFTVNGEPGVFDATLLTETDVGNIGDLSLKLSRDAITWVTAPLTLLYTRSGKHFLEASGVNIAAAGTGNRLYYKIETANNKDIQIRSLGISSRSVSFTGPSTTVMERPAPSYTQHLEGTGLGYDESAGVLRHGRLWGFTQDFEVKGPTRFYLNLQCGVEHLGLPTTTTPVQWIVAMTVTRAANLAALGARPLDEIQTATPPFVGTIERPFFIGDSGNIFGSNEHYKTAEMSDFYDLTDVEAGSAVRFEVWGYSSTDADVPQTSGRIIVGNTESVGYSAYGPFKYNRFTVKREPIR